MRHTAGHLTLEEEIEDCHSQPSHFVGDRGVVGLSKACWARWYSLTVTKFFAAKLPRFAVSPFLPGRDSAHPRHSDTPYSDRCNFIGPFRFRTRGTRLATPDATGIHSGNSSDQPPLQRNCLLTANPRHGIPTAGSPPLPSPNPLWEMKQKPIVSSICSSS